MWAFCVGAERPDLLREEVLADLFEATVLRLPEKTALETERIRLSHSEPDCRADQIALTCWCAGSRRAISWGCGCRVGPISSSRNWQLQKQGLHGYRATQIFLPSALRSAWKMLRRWGSLRTVSWQKGCLVRSRCGCRTSRRAPYQPLLQRADSTCQRLDRLASPALAALMGWHAKLRPFPEHAGDCSRKPFLCCIYR